MPSSSAAGNPVSAALDAPARQDPAPLVVVSHGTGSSPFLHRELAAHLADPPGFDRAAHHPRLLADVHAFLARHLT